MPLPAGLPGVLWVSLAYRKVERDLRKARRNGTVLPRVPPANVGADRALRRSAIHVDL